MHLTNQASALHIKFNYYLFYIHTNFLEQRAYIACCDISLAFLVLLSIAAFLEGRGVFLEEIYISPYSEENKEITDLKYPEKISPVLPLRTVTLVVR